MDTVDFMNSTLFKVGSFHGLLVLQAKHWRQKTRPVFRFLLLALFTSQVYLISKLMDQLPANAWNTIFGNLFEPVIFLCFIAISMFGCLALGYSVMAGKVMKSLVG